MVIPISSLSAFLFERPLLRPEEAEVKGEGLVGLTRGFMYARAAHVLASLWNVSDEATAELMADFYHDLSGNRQLSNMSVVNSRVVGVLN